MNDLPKNIEKMVEERERLRTEGRYKESDVMRRRLEEMGYTVEDRRNGTRVFKQEETAPKASFLLLFGSGEIAPSAVKAHDFVLKGIGKDKPSIVIISTPAGFQPNVKVVCEEIVDFFKQHLANYHPRITVVYANTLEDANNPELVRPLDTADYMFTGPGSPTYAVKHLKGSLLRQKIIERVRAGASLGLASAATIAFSRFALPVYEIYKAGFDLYWEDGLNFYAPIFQELTVIPHFNNNEGGRKNDTSRAWMGKQRFEKLLAILPLRKEVWGIDEHTAVIIDLHTKEIRSIGKGKLWNIKDGMPTPFIV